MTNEPPELQQAIELLRFAATAVYTALGSIDPAGQPVADARQIAAEALELTREYAPRSKFPNHQLSSETGMAGWREYLQHRGLSAAENTRKLMRQAWQKLYGTTCFHTTDHFLTTVIRHLSNTWSDLHVEYMRGEGWVVSSCYVRDTWTNQAHADTLEGALAQAVLLFT